MSKPPAGPPPKAPLKSPKKRDTTPDWRQSLGFGMEVLGGMVGMGLIGWWADTKLGTTPWLILTGFALALAHTVWASLKFMSGGKNPLDDFFKKPPSPPKPPQA